jgi:ABC-2 type transport system ATP-binding protein
MNDDFAIRLRGLTKSYGSVRALRGVDLEVRQSEVFGFLGPNGAGKTTTIRCLMDFIRPNGGELCVLGLDPQRESRELRRRIGYLPGEPSLDGNMSGERAIRYLSALRGVKPEPGRVSEIADRLDADLSRQMKNLSHGNKQKIGILLAFLFRPELIILDEPTTGLDPLIQQVTLQLVREAQAEGATVFFSSHVISVVEALANRVGIIRGGVVVEVADTAELRQRTMRRVRVRFREPADESRFQGVPGISILPTDSPNVLLIEVTGQMDALVDRLAGMSVVDLETEQPTLEEIFLAYYDRGREEA